MIRACLEKIIDRRCIRTIRLSSHERYADGGDGKLWSGSAATVSANADLLVEESLAAQRPTVSGNVLTDGSISQLASTARDRSDQAETARPPNLAAYCSCMRL